ncbi:hypothetical protein ACHAXT_003556 [Thalassiosira profunda]
MARLLVLAAAAVLLRPCWSFTAPPLTRRAPYAGAVAAPSPPLYVATPDAKPISADAHQVDAVQQSIDQFVATLQSSLDDGSFESFTLKGPAAPRKRRKKGGSDADADAALERQKERLRGKFKTISGRLVLLQEKKKRGRGNKKNARKAENAGGTLYLQVTIKFHLATDVAKNMKVGRSSNSERTEVGEGLRQLFSTAMGCNTAELDNGAPLSEWGAKNINGELGILAGELETSSAIYKLQLQPRHNACFKIAKRKAVPTDTQQTNDLSHLSHDRSKNHFLSPSAAFLQKLGVSNADGKPVNGMASKLRQCQKFVEIVGNLVDGAGSSSPPSGIRVIDMGCGRGYLTFSLHSYLCSKFGANNAIKVETHGIDRRPKLIEEINGIASDLGGEFSTLNFVESTIGETHGFFGDDALNEKAKTDGSLDILIALHACDTATDDALWFAIGRDADVIVTAPCCQHELRPQIDRCAADNPDHPLSEVLRHAIYRERSTEIVTDAMRAILLEIAGYSTQVFEFIGGEHTAKNVMLAATKVKTQRSGKEQKEWLEERSGKLRKLAQLYGIKRQRLAMLMGESIAPEDEDGSGNRKVQRNRSGMAPL